MKKFTIYLAGDSTVQSYKTPVKPITGWGQMLHTYFKETEQKIKLPMKMRLKNRLHEYKYNLAGI